MNNFAGVWRQVERLGGCDVIDDVITRTRGPDGDVDRLVQVQVNSNEALKHVRVAGLADQIHRARSKLSFHSTHTRNVRNRHNGRNVSDEPVADVTTAYVPAFWSLRQLSC